MNDPDQDLFSSASAALKLLATLGADHCEVVCSRGNRLEVSVRDQEIELLKEAQSSGLSVRVLVGGRVATSSTTDLREDRVRVFCERVVEMAQFAQPDPLAVPPDPSELGGEAPELELYDAGCAAIDAEAAVQWAMAAERAAMAYDARISASEGASVTRSEGHSCFMTSGGFVGHHKATSHYLSAHVVADDADGKKRNGAFWRGGRRLGLIGDPDAVGREAARRAVVTIGARKIDTGVMPVVFEREVASDIVDLLASVVLGDSLYREQSFLRERIGTRVASEFVTIIDDPHIVGAPGSRQYDGEGRLSRRNVVVEAGMLRSFLLDTYSARKLKLTPNGCGGGAGGIPHSTTSNLILQAGACTPESLLDGIERGLFVTDLMGFGFNPVTGDFSRGASGFLIEGGKLTHPVSEITISRNLDEILQSIDAVANDLELKTSTASPSLRVSSMTISGA